MIVWKDVFSGDEMVSDSYKYKLIHQDACLEIKAKYVIKGSDYVQIAGKSTLFLSFKSILTLFFYVFS